jgi:hypothetical protein
MNALYNLAAYQVLFHKSEVIFVTVAATQLLKFGECGVVA